MKKAQVKRRKTQVSNPDVVRIKQLEEELQSRPDKANNIVDLLELAESGDAAVAHSSSHALYRVFAKHMASGALGRLKNKAEPDVKPIKGPMDEYHDWLHDQYLEFLSLLIGQLGSADQSLQETALTILMLLLELEAQRLRASSGHVFPNTLLRRIVFAVLGRGQVSEQVRETLVQKYVLPYRDVAFYFLRNTRAFMMEKVQSNMTVDKQKEITTRIFQMLQPIRVPTSETEAQFLATGKPKESDDDESESENEQLEGKAAGSLDNFQKAFSECWLELLRLPLTEATYKRVLVMLRRHVLPHLPNPSVLLDFLTDSFDQGGVVSVLALDNLFVLMTEHSLDYPDFYKKLYSLLDREIFYLKYRNRFFHMLGLVMQSILLPSYLVAAFVKKLCRLALHAPPASIGFVLGLSYNLLQRHPNCMAMIHRELCSGVDPFDAAETDPAKSHALESSLWEIDALRQHYLPEVATLAGAFAEPFKVESYDVDAFLDQDYSTMAAQTLKMKVSDTIPTQYNVPTSLLGPRLTAAWSL